MRKSSATLPSQRAVSWPALKAGGGGAQHTRVHPARGSAEHRAAAARRLERFRQKYAHLLPDSPEAERSPITLRPSAVEGVSPAQAREILGSQMLGFEEVLQVFGKTPTPDEQHLLQTVPYSEEELRQAATPGSPAFLVAVPSMRMAVLANFARYSRVDVSLLDESDGFLWEQRSESGWYLLHRDATLALRPGIGAAGLFQAAIMMRHLAVPVTRMATAHTYANDGPFGFQLTTVQNRSGSVMLCCTDMRSTEAP